jgi:recombination protein RecA
MSDIIDRISELSGIKAFRGDDESLKVITIPFGIPNLDNMLGGGAPKGRIMHLSGDFGTGKTVLCQRLMKSVQKEDGRVVYFNVENKFDGSWFSLTGVDISKIVVVQGNIAESVMDGMIACVQDGIDLIVVDSVAALLPITEDEDPVSKQHIGLQSRTVSQGLRKVVKDLALSKSAIIFTNQLRSNIGGYGGDTNPGGRAPKFYASICLNVRRGEWKMDGKKRIGFDMVITSIKNQIAPPWREVVAPFYFDGSFDVISCLMMMASDAGIIKKSGAWYTFSGVRAQDWEGLKNKLSEDKDLLRQLSEEVYQSDIEAAISAEAEDMEVKPEDYDK